MASIDQNSFRVSSALEGTYDVRLPSGCKRKRAGKKCASRCLDTGKFLPLVVVALLMTPTWMKAAHGSSIWDTRRVLQASKSQPPRSSSPTRSPLPLTPTRYLENSTASPARSPVSQPANPAFAPTVQPSTSRVPSEAPLGITLAPISKNPTSKPTLKPTSSPTEAPQLAPTTRIPTRRPTRSPITLKPTPSPTLLPSTGEPTFPPTKDISAPPSPGVDGQSDPSPTLSPIIPPSVTPSYAPFAANIFNPPTEAPSPSFQFEKSTQRVRDVSFIALRRSQRILQSEDEDIDSNCMEIWQESMQERIKTEVVAALQQLESAHVKLLDVSKRTNATVLSFVFDVLMEVRSPGFDSSDAARIVLGPFDSQAERNTFSELLKSSNCSAFGSIDDFAIIVPSMAEEQAPKDSGTSSAALYAGLAVAGAAIVMMGITILSYARVRNKRRIDHHELTPIYVSNPRTTTPSVIGGKSKNSDISTLGDPIPFGATNDRNDGDVSTNESFSIEYDYKHAFLDVHSEIDSQVGISLDEQTMEAILSGQMTLSMTDDIATAGGNTGASSQPMVSEEQFDVVVPPGVLGLILESNADDGRPTVYNIKPNSILSSIIKVGDRIESVDGEYMATMKACDVSRVIAHKQDHVRVLVFSRPTKRKTYPL